MDKINYLTEFETNNNHSIESNIKKDYSVFTVINEKISVPDKYLSPYSKVLQELENYSTAIVLYGVKRSGKTTILDQLYKTIGKEKILYISLNIGCSCTYNDLSDIIEQSNKEFVFIDEITRLQDFSSSLHNLINAHFTNNKKLVLSGTDTIMFKIAQLGELTGKLRLVNTFPLTFNDCKLLFRDCEFTTFSDDGYSVNDYSDEEYIVNLSESIKGYINKLDRSEEHSLDYYDDYNLIFEAILNYIFGVKENKIKAPRFRIDGRYMIGEKLQLLNVSTNAVNSMFWILSNMNIINILPRCSIENNQIVPYSSMFYITSSKMFNALYNTSCMTGDNPGVFYNRVHNKHLGYLFESVVIYEIQLKLKSLGLREIYDYNIYSLKDQFSDTYEMDLCIEYIDKNRECTVSLIEFKRTYGFYGKHFSNSVINNYYSTEYFNNINKYTIYTNRLTDAQYNKLSIESSTYINGLKYKDDSRSIHIEDFLNDIENFIK